MQIQYVWSYKCSSAEPTYACPFTDLEKDSADTLFSFPLHLLSPHTDTSQRNSLSWSPLKTGTTTKSPFCSPFLKSVAKTITNKAQYKPKGSENKAFYDISHVTIPCSQAMVSPPTILFLSPSDKHMDKQQ